MDRAPVVHRRASSCRSHQYRLTITFFVPLIPALIVHGLEDRRHRSPDTPPNKPMDSAILLGVIVSVKGWFLGSVQVQVVGEFTADGVMG